MLYDYITIDSKSKFGIGFLSIFNNRMLAMVFIGNAIVPELERNFVAQAVLLPKKMQ